MSPSSVRMRPLAVADGPRVLAWRNTPEVADFMYGDHRISPAEHEAWLARTLADPGARFWVVELDGAPVGLSGLTRMGEAGRGEWSNYLGEPAARGRGAAAAAERLLLGWAFEVRGLRKVWCEVLADNAPALRLHEGFGFAREALLREHVVKAGRPRNVVGLGLLASEWPAVRAAADRRLRARGWPRSALTLAS